ncbi:MAG: GTP 3',8-cyclase MoaA [Actinobacteria bacterium]|nr:GTP 3',8-cyclase MoaA [Actinomycetota bacterium]MCB9412769.1 GTP 3',8-cyclase MoaA [Actinomycetota bacterium]
MSLIDAYGRIHTDLRVSLTDRCSLRCSYCMPAEGLPWLPGEAMLSTPELIRLVGVAVGAGISTVRLTGGEPLLHPDVLEIVACIAQLPERPEVSLTTNGIRLAGLASQLADAGLRRVNVSLDTLNRATFVELTKRDRLVQTQAGIKAAQLAGLHPVKVNAVLLRGINDHQASDLLYWALSEGVELRFIEQMPLDPQHGWRRDQMVTAAEILQRLRSDGWRLEPDPVRGNAPAALWRIDGGPEAVGIVASVTMPFCGDCNRVRLTADGQWRNCLFARDEADLRTLLRQGATDADLLAVMRAETAAKRPGHGLAEPGFEQPERPMSAIGG